MSKKRIIVTLILLLRQRWRARQNGFWIVREQVRFLVTEVALEIFEHPKPDFPQAQTILKTNLIRRFF